MFRPNRDLIVRSGTGLDGYPIDVGEDPRSYALQEADQARWRAGEALRRVREAIDRRNLDEARRFAAEAHQYAARARVLDRLAARD